MLAITTHDTDNDCLDSEGSAAYYYHQDANWRVVMLTDEDGFVAERYRYTAYGEPEIYSGYDDLAGGELGHPMLTSRIGNPFMHQGLVYDGDTRTYHNRFRQYNPRLGRFMQRDPEGYVDGMNVYEYMHGAPIYYVDALGTQTTDNEFYFDDWSPATDPWVQAAAKENARLAERAKELALTVEKLRKLEAAERTYSFKYDAAQETLNIGQAAWEKLLAEVQRMNANARAFDEFRAQLLALTWSNAYRDWNSNAKQYYTRLKAHLARQRNMWATLNLVRELRKTWKWSGVEGPTWPLCCFLQYAICTQVEKGKCTPACCDHYTRECLKGGDNACHGGNRPGSPKPPSGCPKAECCFTARID